MQEGSVSDLTPEPLIDTPTNRRRVNHEKSFQSMRQRPSSSVFQKISWPLVVGICTFCLTLYYDLNMIWLTKNLQKANTFNAIHVDYSNPETSESIETLENFINEFGRERYAEVYIQMKIKGEEEARKIDKARRRLSHLYSRIHYLYEFGFLSDNDINLFPGADRAGYFVDIVEPLEWISKTTAGRDAGILFTWLRQKFKLGPSLFDENLKYKYKLLLSKKPSRKELYDDVKLMSPTCTPSTSPTELTSNIFEDFSEFESN